ncbi:hypothetical protein [Paenibacillus senegalensis]|uniref:hypothetical protein n=1 Tax=Paenibacillus senegalensis TaxID=1465766 RepID=UPI0002894634|nr:hypothetical protein [Paenibacillus senegalensis]
MGKKLSGNGLWESSRMMLPEHREILVERRKYPAANDEGALQPADRRLVRQSVVLPVALSITRGNFKRLKAFPTPLHKLYVQATMLLIDCLHRDEVKIRQELAAKGIEVRQESAEDALHCRWMYRGAEESFTFTRDALRQEVALQLQNYITALFSSANARQS